MFVSAELTAGAGYLAVVAVAVVGALLKNSPQIAGVGSAVGTVGTVDTVAAVAAAAGADVHAVDHIQDSPDDIGARSTQSSNDPSHRLRRCYHGQSGGP